ncbi:hypothetical protein AALO_G00191510 [Alosa alosa]|uniref:Uncharacterized protein n=1 Tax=Alosa alosa TaxID=278164 RepID=A0AAV6GAA3_9TELE|nr:hypothetical protein AALO_G00191510 [Alosa alosa]
MSRFSCLNKFKHATVSDFSTLGPGGEETEKATEEVSELPKDEKLKAQQVLSTTEFSSITTPTQDDTKGHVGDTNSSLAPTQQEEGYSEALETGSDQEVSEELRRCLS